MQSCSHFVTSIINKLAFDAEIDLNKNREKFHYLAF